MKLLISFLMFFSCATMYAQQEIQPEIGFSGNAAAFGFYNTNRVHDWSNQEIHSNPYNSGNGYIGFNSRLGFRQQLSNKSLYFCGQYQWIRNGDIHENKPNFTSNLLGISAELRLFEKSNVRLFFNIQLMSEVYSEYRDSYLRKQDYSPISNYYVLPLSSHSYEKVKTNVYKGTPFLGNFLIGLNVRIIDELSFNFSAGYGMRMLKSQLASLTYVYNVSLSEPTEQENINSSYLVPFHMLDFQTGLSYTFSMNKKLKTEIP